MAKSLPRRPWWFFPYKDKASLLVYKSMTIALCFCRYLFPIAFLIFNVLYATYYAISIQIYRTRLGEDIMAGVNNSDSQTEWPWMTSANVHLFKQHCRLTLNSTLLFHLTLNFSWPSASSSVQALYINWKRTVQCFCDCLFPFSAWQNYELLCMLRQHFILRYDSWNRFIKKNTFCTSKTISICHF